MIHTEPAERSSPRLVCNIISNKYYIMKKNDEKMYYVCCDKCSIRNDPLCCDHVQGYYDILNQNHHFKQK